MTYSIPHTFINPSHVGLIILPDTEKAPSPDMSDLMKRELPSFKVNDLSIPPWSNDRLIAFLSGVDWKQTLILSASVSSYMSALVMMSIETGLRTHLVLDSEIDFRVSRLSQLLHLGVFVSQPSHIVEDLDLLKA